MILANGINLPIMTVFGVVTLGPLTLLVTLIESCVFRNQLGAPVRSVFKRILMANVYSTLAGGLVLVFQDAIVRRAGILASIPSFVRGYRWVGPLLIALYFAKSLLVEGFCLTRRRFLERLDRPVGRMLRTVVLANAASYLIVGPLFYVTTRPHFAGLHTTFDASWTANAELVMYYVDSDDHFVKRKPLGAKESRTLIPYATSTFLISDDESTFAFVGTNRHLFALRAGDNEPILLSDSTEPYFIRSVSISPDHRRVAFVVPPAGEKWPYQVQGEETLTTVDLNSRERVEVGKLPPTDWGTPIAWSADGEVIFTHSVDLALHPRNEGRFMPSMTICAFNANPPYGLRTTLAKPPAPDELTIQYARTRGSPISRSGEAMMLPDPHLKANGYELEIRPYPGGDLRVKRDGRTALRLQNAYGLLNFGFPAIHAVAPLPNGDELLLEWWGQSYVLSLKEGRLGLAAHGSQFVLRTPEFRVVLPAGDE